MSSSQGHHEWQSHSGPLLALQPLLAPYAGLKVLSCLFALLPPHLASKTSTTSRWLPGHWFQDSCPCPDPHRHPYSGPGCPSPHDVLSPLEPKYADLLSPATNPPLVACPDTPQVPGLFDVRFLSTSYTCWSWSAPFPTPHLQCLQLSGLPPLLPTPSVTPAHRK